MFPFLIYIIFLISHAKCTVRNFGEICNNTIDECIDYRMICSKSINDNVTRCWCDRFHAWSNVSLTCIQKYNISVILEMAVKITDNISNVKVYKTDDNVDDFKRNDVLDELSKEQERVYRGATYSAYFVLGVGISCVFIVIGYCFYQRRSDARLLRTVRSLEIAKKETVPPRVSTSLFNV